METYMKQTLETNSFGDVSILLVFYVNLIHNIFIEKKKTLIVDGLAKLRLSFSLESVCFLHHYFLCYFLCVK